MEYNFRSHSDDGYLFYLGDIFLGTVFEYESGWDALSILENRYGRIMGFKTHIDAGRYLVQVLDTVKKECGWDDVNNEIIDEWISNKEI